MARLQDYDIKTQHKAIVKKTDRLTPEGTEEVREIVVEIDRPEFEYKVGQSVGVLVEGQHEFGNNVHHRLYSVADIPSKSKKPQIKLLVKRCSYVDDFSGEIFDGVASHYLCNKKVGDEILLTGPFGLPFDLPEDKNSDLLLIGMGTGIAPFRALVRHLYKNVKDWKGKVRLFYGARSGLELLYMNDKNDDLTSYYDEDTFEAFQALSPRPHWADPIALDYALEQRTEEILQMLDKSNTHVFVAGHDKISDMLDKAFVTILGSKEKWQNRKAELIAGKRWAEVIY
ncbi:MAG: ferredoxin-NADP reductase [Calditrichaeota bacterium]|nr:MAG: ferredoxin-NADP reductase [Calditrichota bacterium]MBL1206634.1 ferredoxin-NADP reductase [Calditrichota bacterium]NOG46461.1 ferredoxin-NADP reductase [Calditrichota bacterium]